MSDKGKILVVDDQVAALRLLSELLKAEGYAVRAADSGELALLSAAASTPELILLDIRMPGLDGFEVCRRLKAQPSTQAVPIIFLSAATATEEKVQGLQLGAVDFVSKPFQREELLARVHTHLELFRLRTSLEACIADRTAELRTANARLQQELAERKQAEAEVRQLNSELDERVRARTAELEAANRELEAFAYSVSHDLRAPLRTIDGFSRILQEDYQAQLDEAGRRHLQVLRDSALRMGQLIEAILSFSRMGRQEMAAMPFDMALLAREVAAELQAQEPERVLRFEIGPLPPARGDRLLLRQVLVNLLANAVKFTRPKPDALIKVSGNAGSEETVYTVKDNGVGFDTGHADKLFGVFQRLHSQEEFEGTGIGLAIVKRIVERHGGRVWAESRLGEGAALSFALPNGPAAASC
jgi:signal transduction histidine kinase